MTKDILEVAVDGSSFQGKGGYGGAANDGSFWWDHCDGYSNPEWEAIRSALVKHPSRPLLVKTDHQEAILRLVDGTPPRPGNTHKDAIAHIKALLAERTPTAAVQFQLITQGSHQDALHACAHLLAYFGRTRREVSKDVMDRLLTEIRASPEPNVTSHDIVTSLVLLRDLAKGPETHADHLVRSLGLRTERNGYEAFLIGRTLYVGHCSSPEQAEDAFRLLGLPKNRGECITALRTLLPTEFLAKLRGSDEVTKITAPPERVNALVSQERERSADGSR